MMIGLRTRPAILFGGMLVAALLALLPMRLVLGWLGAGEQGVSAREVVGPVWWGGLGETRFGNVPLGDVSAGLSPLHLLTGQARIDVQGRADSTNAQLRGALRSSGSMSGVDDVTARLPVGDAFAPLPVVALDLDKVTVHFRDGLCERAEGRITASIAAAMVPQLSLPQSMTGTAKCDAGVLSIPLVSAAGTESILLTVRPNGHYGALLTAQPADAAAAAALTSAGFQPGGNGYRLAIRGSF